MQEELNQFSINQILTRTERSKDIPVIGTKWVFINKMDEDREFTMNKARLVEKGYSQEERH